MEVLLEVKHLVPKPVVKVELVELCLLQKRLLLLEPYFPEVMDLQFLVQLMAVVVEHQVVHQEEVPQHRDHC